MQEEMPRRTGRRSALDLLRKIRSREILPNEVSTQERRICAAYLRLEGYTQEETAEIFEVSRQTISRDEAALRRETARLVEEIDVKAMTGGLIAWARHITAKALKEKDHALAWRVQRELVSDLQGLGYLPKAVEQHDIRIGTFVDLARLAAQENPGELAGGRPAAIQAPREERNASSGETSKEEET
jgi:DNA-binding XRE family transcriptional regulator